jgi:hypothetical protein
LELDERVASVLERRLVQLGLLEPGRCDNV